MRDACRSLLTGFDESMRYRMPACSRNGITEIGWASQQQYISQYMMRGDVLDAHRGQVAQPPGMPATGSVPRIETENGPRESRPCQSEKMTRPHNGTCPI
jgi:hypothetical protein